MEIVFDDDNSCLLVFIDIFDSFKYFFHHFGREAERRLIEKEELGPGHQPASDGKELLLPSGECPGILTALFTKHWEKMHQMLCPSTTFFLVIQGKSANFQILQNG